MIRILSLFLLLASIEANASLVEAARQLCHGSLKEVPPLDADLSNLAVMRESFLRRGLLKGLPAMIKKNSNGEELPVFLVNNQNSDAFKEFAQRSIGMMIIHNPGSPVGADHGIFRFREIVTDSNTPSRRSFGEIHQTGIAWSTLASMNQYHRDSLVDKGHRHTPIEAIFFPPEDMMDDVQHYLIVRRSAIVRIRQKFDSERLNAQGLNYLDAPAEHCFDYSKCLGVGSVPEIIIDKIRQLVGSDPESYLESTEIKSWLQSFHALLANMEMVIDAGRAESIYHPDLAWDFFQKLDEEVKRKILSKVSGEEDSKRLINWIAGYDAFVRMRRAASLLNISSSWDTHEWKSSNAAGVVIYDVSDEAEAKFVDGSYTSNGSNTDAWSTYGQTSVTASQVIP